MGFEPTNGGFADLSLGPLGYRAELLIIANIAANCQDASRACFRLFLLHRLRKIYFHFAEESRRFFRRRGIDVKTSAPLESRNLC